MIDLEFVKSILHYDSNSGVFTRLVNRHKYRAGEIAGRIDSKGHRQLSICGKRYMAHRIAWMFFYGTPPNGEIDHINHVKDDNRISNLRDVSHISNARNKSHHKNNTSGIIGVYFHKRLSKWTASIADGSKQIHIGYFELKEEAIAARKAAEEIHGYHENHGRITC